MKWFIGAALLLGVVYWKPMASADPKLKMGCVIVREEGPKISRCEDSEAICYMKDGEYLSCFPRGK